MLNYIRKHWRGELPLAVSYWVNAFLASTLALAVVLTITPSVERSLNPSLLLIALAATYSLLLIITTWQLVGTWRSAENHKKKNKKVFWATVAQIMIALGALNSVKTLTDGAIQIRELFKIAAKSDAMSTFALEVKNGSEIHISGWITFELAKTLDNHFKYNPNIREIHLNSPGGRIGPAIHIAKQIEALGLDTYSEGMCLSACTTIFIAGTNRSAGVGTKFGFHARAMPGMSEEEIEVIHNDEIRYLITRGIPRDFLDKAFSTPNDEMWYPDYLTLADAQVITNVKIGSELLPVYDYCALEDCRTSSTAPVWLQQVAAEINLTTPRRLDEITTLERTTSGPGGRLTYTYTLELDEYVDFEIVREQLLKSACNESQLAIFFKSGVTMTWRYFNIEGKEVYQVSLRDADCSAANETQRVGGF